MSKASEWAKTYAAVAPAPTFRAHGALIATIGYNGELLLCSLGVIPPLTCGEAITFARWILDTFGES